jgi:hypothetical protein
MPCKFLMTDGCAYDYGVRMMTCFTHRTFRAATLLLAAAAVSAPLPAKAADDKGLYQTLYFVSCATYAKDRKEPENTGKNAVDKIYVSGWLTGFNYLTPNTYDIIPNHNVDMVLQWLDQYCAKSPEKNLEAGLLQLTDTLYPDRVKNFPKAEAETAAKSTAKKKPEAKAKAKPAPKPEPTFDDLHFHIPDKK